MDTGILDHKVDYSEDFIKILKTWFYTHTYIKMMKLVN